MLLFNTDFTLQSFASNIFVLQNSYAITHIKSSKDHYIPTFLTKVITYVELEATFECINDLKPKVIFPTWKLINDKKDS